ncbi:MAG: ornithine aminomutase subunit alpha [Gammaproteobacteria bacterium]|jgi:D-ornithine 4,5-aminomutase subunit alpha|nr:ornithine aminomutase subunit alpha [Gammaproteobacteria bacterium]
MSCVERADDFEKRREKLQAMSDEELHHHFWRLVEKIVEPLIEEARSHTTPSIERSILLRMGFSSIEARELVAKIQQHNLLGHGAGRLLLELAKAKQLSIHEAGSALLSGQYWEELPV